MKCLLLVVLIGLTGCASKAVVKKVAIQVDTSYIVTRYDGESATVKGNPPPVVGDILKVFWSTRQSY
ncbi:MAG TPA: hypothetical protein VJ044_05990 [Candidatus Hodarchaeales archaeon]|nr:hypothetical protein [Candidatus Hodarchaeales archaeon]